MKIQPVDIDSMGRREAIRPETAKPVLKSRLKRLFDRQFPSVLRTSTAEKTSTVGVDPPQYNFRDGGGTVSTEFEPSSVCLAKMVQNFIEESSEKQPVAAKCGRNRCNCFNANINDSSDDEFDVFGGGFGESLRNGSSSDASDILKSLILCASVTERNLLADTSKIVEKKKNHKRKDDLTKFVNEGLTTLGYNSSICTSKWDKTPSFPAGVYEYIDVIVDGERLLIDIDFRSEFEIARSTGAYKAILQSLPYIFVGKTDRLQQIVSILSEAANVSLKKKGMHLPPWRKAEYMRSKWLSSFTRATTTTVQNDAGLVEPTATDMETCGGDLELIFGDDNETSSSKEESVAGVSMMWQLPPVKPKSVEKGVKIITGLASILKDKS